MTHNPAAAHPRLMALLDGMEKIDWQDADCGMLAEAIRRHYYGNILVKPTGKRPPSPRQWRVEVSAANSFYAVENETQWAALTAMREHLDAEAGLPGFIMPPLPSAFLPPLLADLRGKAEAAHRLWFWAATRLAAVERERDALREGLC